MPNILGTRTRQFAQRLLTRAGYSVERIGATRSDRLLRPWLERLSARAPVRTVFDVGANRGQTVRALRPLLPDAIIHAFEPFGPPYAELQRLAHADGRVRTYQLALGNRSEETTLYTNAADWTNSLLPNSDAADQFTPEGWCVPSGTTTVTVDRLDRFCRREGIATIDVLKIDVQGTERAVLDGAGEMLSPASIRGVLMELLFVPYYRGQAWGGELIELMRSRGYALFGLAEVAFGRKQGWRWADALFLEAPPVE